MYPWKGYYEMGFYALENSSFIVMISPFASPARLEVGAQCDASLFPVREISP
jgi:hypothetical protein